MTITFKNLLGTLALLSACVGTVYAQQSELAARGGISVEVGPAFMRSQGTGDSEVDSADYAGGMLSVGWRFQQAAQGNIFGHRVHLDVGYLYHSEDSADKDHVKNTFKSTMVPLLVGYDFYIPLNQNRTAEWRIGVTGGMAWFNDTFTTSGAPELSNDLKDSTYIYGLGTGVTFHLTKALYLDFGYRYLRTGSVGRTARDENGIERYYEMGKTQNHLVTGSLGIKF